MLIQRNFGVRAKKKTRGHKEERDLDRFEIQKLLRQILRALRDPGFFQSDLRLAHDRFGSSSDPTLNGRVHYNDIDKSLNEVANDKIRKYRAECNHNPPDTVVFTPDILLVRMDV
jgi:hypothetical protein